MTKLPQMKKISFFSSIFPNEVRNWKSLNCRAWSLSTMRQKTRVTESNSLWSAGKKCNRSALSEHVHLIGVTISTPALNTCYGSKGRWFILVVGKRWCESKHLASGYAREMPTREPIIFVLLRLSVILITGAGPWQMDEIHRLCGTIAYTHTHTHINDVTSCSLIS